MDLISNSISYIHNREFNCSYRFNTDTGEWSQDVPAYAFNTAEKIGNQLLQPLDLSLKGFEAAPDAWVKAALAVACFFSAFIGAIGFAFKTYGEGQNPHSQLRYEALAKIEEIQSLATTLSKDPVSAFENISQSLRKAGELYQAAKAELTNWFKREFAIQKKAPADVEQFSDQNLGFFNYYLAVQQGFAARETISAFSQNWHKSLGQFTEALRQGYDGENESASLLELCQENEALAQKTGDFINYSKQMFHDIFALNDAAVAYNGLIDQMALPPALPNPEINS